MGYEVGSNGETLGPVFMNDLDNELVPVIHKIGPGGGATSPSFGKPCLSEENVLPTEHCTLLQVLSENE